VFKPNLNTPAWRCKFDCIGQEVPYDLLQTVWIDRYRNGERIKLTVDFNPLGLGRRAECVNGRFNNRHDFHLADFQTELARNNVRNTQEVFDKLSLQLRALLNALKRACQTGFFAITGAQ
jgi:hypothetical protein